MLQDSSGQTQCPTVAASRNIDDGDENEQQWPFLPPGVLNTFPVVFHTMLERSDDSCYSHIVSWGRHGKTFKVHNKDRFVKEILPMFSRQSHFGSFQRQLNLYGFHRISKRGPDYGSYQHDQFIRGRPDLAAAMIRVKSTTESNCEASVTPQPIQTADRMYEAAMPAKAALAVPSAMPIVQQYDQDEVIHPSMMLRPLNQGGISLTDLSDTLIPLDGKVEDTTPIPVPRPETQGSSLIGTLAAENLEDDFMGEEICEFLDEVDL